MFRRDWHMILCNWFIKILSIDTLRKLKRKNDARLHFQQQPKKSPLLNFSGHVTRAKLFFGGGALLTDFHFIFLILSHICIELSFVKKMFWSIYICSFGNPIQT